MKHNSTHKTPHRASMLLRSSPVLMRSCDGNVCCLASPLCADPVRDSASSPGGPLVNENGDASVSFCLCVVPPLPAVPPLTIAPVPSRTAEPLGGTTPPRPSSRSGDPSDGSTSADGAVAAGTGADARRPLPCAASLEASRRKVRCRERLRREKRPVLMLWWMDTARAALQAVV